MKKLWRLAVLSVLLWSSSSLLGAALPAGWKSLATARKAEGNFRAELKGQDPCQFIVQQKGGRIVELAISKDTVSAKELFDGGKSNALAVPKLFPVNTSGETQEITIKVRENEWTIYVGGQLKAIMPAPFALPGAVCAPEAQATRMAGAAKFLPVPRAQYITNFMIEEGAKNELYPWSIQTGSWHLHTAQAEAVARPETNQQRAKEAPLTADKSPNFYSLKGGGKNVDNVITTGYDINDNYAITGSIQLENGEAGVIFYHRDAPVAEGQKPDPAKAEFYAFTLRMNVPAPGMHDVRLWKQKDGKKTVLARANVPLYSNQWYLPGVAAHGNEIICYLDNYELFRVKENLPVSGKYGLFVNTPEEMRLDDVTVKHFADIKLETASELAFNMLSAEGSVTLDGKAVAAAPAESKTVLAMGGAQPAKLLLGRAHSSNEVFSARFKPQGTAWKIGLTGCWQTAAGASLEFAVERKGDSEIYTLSRVKAGAAPEVIDTFEHKLWDDEKTADIKLMMDATEAGILRCLRNGRLVHFIEDPKGFTGAFGVWTAAGTQSEVSELKLDTDREIFKEKPQKNPVFEKDSFMRHWASPEGQWIAGKGNAMWHKGDFFSDYLITLPCIPNSELHVAVNDDAIDGAVAISIKDGKLILTVNEPSVGKPVTQEVALTAPEGKGIDVLDYTLHHEGYWLWVHANGKTVLKHRLTDNLRKCGTKARVRGLNLDQLHRSKVTRNNVIDEFFYESPHDWLANGGDWKIINRFQCTPSWSHMIAEAYDSLGAFWRKQIFKGDMTLEFYAGSRQGAYDVMGNLNCTIMAADTTANSGYTVACTEWDQNLSQNWTTLYKNGNIMTRSDAYLVPRTRKDLRRRILNPLIAEGRPYHGAWYYIKLRKIGDKLEYYFDDELIFTQKDPQAIQEGIVGIWTFIHSMTLAQIKITFDEVRPRPYSVTMTSVDDPAVPAAVANVPFESRLNGFPVDSLNKSRWSINDTVGQSKLTDFEVRGAQALLYKNPLGAGNMRMNANLPIMKYWQVAGWSCKIKRTDKALFNAFYCIGNVDDKGTFKEARNQFFRISGTDFSDGAWHKVGDITVAPVASVTAEDKDWVDVTMLIPGRLHHPHDEKRAMQVRFDGFGTEQRDAIENGIWGNVPGSAYAVSDFMVITYDAPVLELAAGETFKAYTDADGKNAIAAATPAELTAKLNALSKPGLNSAWLDLTKGGKTMRRELRWLKLADKVAFKVEWNKQENDTIRVSNTSGTPDPRLFNYTVTAGDVKVASNIFNRFRSNDESFVISLPHNDKIQSQFASGKLMLSLKNGTVTETATLAVNDTVRRNGGPVLHKLNGFTPFFCSFENGLDGTPLMHGKNFRRLMQLADDDNGQGQYLKVRNITQQRLLTPFDITMNVASYPVAQMRYRASDMAIVSMDFFTGEPAYARLSSVDSNHYTSSSAVATRLSKEFIKDEQWHNWTGIVSDAFNHNAWRPDRFIIKHFEIRSIGNSDQTGRYSWLALDDFVFGPAVRSADQLVFTPEYFDFDGVAAVFMAQSAKDTMYLDLPEAERKALVWTKFEPGKALSPSIAGLADGVHHVFIKAVDTRNNESPVTDLPFMLSTKPLEPSFAFNASKAPFHNGTKLDIAFNNHGAAPLQLDKTTFKVGKDGKPGVLESWTQAYQHTYNQDVLSLNHPFIFRELLNHAKNGDVLDFTLGNLIDGAGNTIPDLTIPIKVDYASDKTGPSWYTMAFGSSVAWFYNWDGAQSQSQQFHQGSNNHLAILTPFNHTPYLENGTYYDKGDLVKSLSWKPSRYPFIGFRVFKNVIRNGNTFHLILVTQDKKTYSVSLNGPGKEATELNRSHTFTWKAGTWMHFIIDLPAYMREAGLDQKTIDDMTLVSISFQRRGGNHHNDILGLDDFMVFGAPTNPAEPDIMQWTGYDASGIASLEMTCVDDNLKELFTHSFADCHKADLNALRAKFEGTRWFRVCAKDKAGNLSIPFWLPVYSPAKPKPAPAPAAPAKPAAPAAPAPAAPAKPAAPAPAAK